MTPYIIPLIAIALLYVLVRFLNKKGILHTYNKISGTKYLALAALFIVFAISPLSKQDNIKDKIITIMLLAALVSYFVYKYFKTKKTSQ